jgi:hypothetical protein
VDRGAPALPNPVQIISLSLAHLGLGLLIVLAFVGVREVGRGFFTLCGWCGVGLTIAGWLLSGVPGGAQSEGPASSDAVLSRGGDLPWEIAAAALVLFIAGWIALRVRRRDIAGPLTRIAGAAAAVAVFWQGFAIARESIALAAAGSSTGVGGTASPALAAAVPWLSATDFLLSAGLLGGVTVAMVLGHWYLVQPGLEIEPLARLSWVYIAFLGARTLLEIGGVIGAISHGGISLSAPAGEVLAFPALVLAQRELFGLIAPIILAPLVYRTVTMRSTMSATGLLYVAVALVWVGEFLSKYLLLPLRLV